MYLFINTTNSKKITLALINKKGEILVSKQVKAEYKQSEKLLLNIEKILLTIPLKWHRLSGVIVVLGPGGFTSLRIGVATANALAFALQIPITGVLSKNNSDKKLIEMGYKKIIKLKKFKQVLPKYGQEALSSHLPKASLLKE